MSAPSQLAPDATPEAPLQGHSLWADAWKRLKKNRLAVASAFFIVVVAIGGYGSIVSGSGTVVAQDPPAGRSLPAGRQCTLRLADAPSEVVQ